MQPPITTSTNTQARLTTYSCSLQEYTDIEDEESDTPKNSYSFCCCRRRRAAAATAAAAAAAAAASGDNKGGKDEQLWSLCTTLFGQKSNQIRKELHPETRTMASMEQPAAAAVLRKKISGGGGRFKQIIPDSSNFPIMSYVYVHWVRVTAPFAKTIQPRVELLHGKLPNGDISHGFVSVSRGIRLFLVSSQKRF